MVKNIHVESNQDVFEGYEVTSTLKGVDEAAFGYQDDIIEPYLKRKIGKSGIVKVSTTPKAGYVTARLRKEDDGFIVTEPKSIRGHRFCSEGVQSVLGKAAAKKPYINVYFTTVKA